MEKNEAMVKTSPLNPLADFAMLPFTLFQRLIATMVATTESKCNL